jgi:exodeoxyribonuclease VII small subunit
MPDERYTFETARIRLEEIAVEVRKKDTSLEKSLDLLEEGVRLANICTELVDHTDLGASVVVETPELETEDRASDGESATPERATDAAARDSSAADDGGDALADAPEGAGSEEDPVADAEGEARLGTEDDERDVDGADDADDDGVDEGPGDDSGDEDDGDGAPDVTGSFDDTEDDLHEPGETAGDD